MVNSREKGRRAEIAAAKAVQQVLQFPEAVRAGQVSGQYAADLLYTGNLHVEVKCHKKIGALRFMDQAQADHDEGTIPVVLMRESRGDWHLVFRLDDATRVVAALKHLLDE